MSTLQDRSATCGIQYSRVSSRSVLDGGILTMVRKTYTNVSLEPDAVDKLRRLAFGLSAALGRRVTLSEVVTVMDHMFTAHDATAAELAKEVVGE